MKSYPSPRRLESNHPVLGAQRATSANLCRGQCASRNPSGSPSASCEASAVLMSFAMPKRPATVRMDSPPGSFRIPLWVSSARYCHAASRFCSGCISSARASQFTSLETSTALRQSIGNTRVGTACRFASRYASSRWCPSTTYRPQQTPRASLLPRETAVDTSATKNPAITRGYP